MIPAEYSKDIETGDPFLSLLISSPFSLLPPVIVHSCHIRKLAGVIRSCPASFSLRSLTAIWFTLALKNLTLSRPCIPYYHAREKSLPGNQPFASCRGTWEPPDLSILRTSRRLRAGFTAMRSHLSISSRWLRKSRSLAMMTRRKTWTL